MRPNNREPELLDSRASRFTAEVMELIHSPAELSAGGTLTSDPLANVLHAIKDRIFLKDLDGKITFVNQAFLQFYKLTSDQVLGKYDHDFLPKELASVCTSTNQAVLEFGETVYLETLWREIGSDSHYWSETHKSPLRNSEGDVIGIVDVSRDITDARMGELQSKRNEAMLLHASRLSSLGELTAGIAHEVNQPLFSILNYAKAIENKLQDKEKLDIEAIRGWIQQIYREASRGGKIIRRIKSYVKPAEGVQKLSDINTLVLESLEFMAIESQDAGAKIETDLAAGLPALLVDRIQIQQTLVNLCKNALEACSEQPEVNPNIVISTRFHSGYVQVTITDNGPGLSTASEVNLFDPFQTTKQDGIGLGLTISNTIIEAHQGKMTYHPNDTEGMTFGFILPVNNAEETSR